MLASWKPPCFTVVLVLVPFWNSEHIWQAEYVEKLEPGLHSTKGIGKTEPDPAGSKELDGCKVILKKWTCHTSWTPPKVKIWRIATTETLQVPAGAGVKDSSRKTDLLYNEYIVYDVAQVFFLYSEDQVKGSWYKPNASPSPLTPLLFQNNVALYWRLFLSWLFSWLVHRLSQSGAKCASVAFLIWPMKTN